MAAFGYYAGYAGAAIALLAWSHQLTHPETPIPSLPSYPSKAAVIDSIKSAISSSVSAHNGNQPPRVLIAGALGRYGTGAVDFCLAAGVPPSSRSEMGHGGDGTGRTICGNLGRRYFYQLHLSRGANSTFRYVRVPTSPCRIPGAGFAWFATSVATPTVRVTLCQFTVRSARFWAPRYRWRWTGTGSR